MKIDRVWLVVTYSLRELRGDDMRAERQQLSGHAEYAISLQFELQSGNANTAVMDTIAAVHRDQKGRNALDNTGHFQRASVNWAQAWNQLHQLEENLLGRLVVSAHKDVTLGNY